MNFVFHELIGDMVWVLNMVICLKSVDGIEGPSIDPTLNSHPPSCVITKAFI